MWITCIFSFSKSCLLLELNSVFKKYPLSLKYLRTALETLLNLHFPRCLLADIGKDGIVKCVLQIFSQID